MNRHKSLRYALLGSGRMASHIAHYFRGKEIIFQQWSRNNNAEFNTFRFDKTADRLKATLQGCDVVLLMIKDDALFEFYENFLKDTSRPVVHFSGSFYHPEMVGCHPLFTFSKSLYDRSVYEQITFVCDQEKADFHQLFPALKNKVLSIRAEKKPLYHALCVMSGNFTSLLWQQSLMLFESELNIPTEAALTYLDQIVSNIKDDPQNCATGPLVRGDLLTVKSNIEALGKYDLDNLYQCFVQQFSPNISDESVEKK